MPRPTYMCANWPPKSCIDPYLCSYDGSCRGCIEEPPGVKYIRCPRGAHCPIPEVCSVEGCCGRHPSQED